MANLIAVVVVVNNWHMLAVWIVDEAAASWLDCYSPHFLKMTENNFIQYNQYDKKCFREIIIDELTKFFYLK